MQFENIVKEIAETYKCHYEIHPSASTIAQIGIQPLPVIIKQLESQGNIQWFDIEVMLGSIVDFAEFPALSLLEKNYFNDGRYAVKVMKNGASILSVKIRCAVPISMSNSEVANILGAKSWTPFHFSGVSIPGIEPLEY
jgi:hypothetical protein